MREGRSFAGIALLAALALALAAISAGSVTRLVAAMSREAEDGYAKWALSVAKGLANGVAPEEDVPVFRWTKGKGVTDPGTTPASVLAAIDGETKWKSDGRASASLPCGVFTIGGETVAWGRPKAGEVTGAALPRLSATDAGSRVRFWRTVGIAVTPIAALLLAAAMSLAMREREARRVAREKVSFVDSVTHELKTPLTPIMMTAGMIAAGAVRDPEAIRERARKIVENAGRLDRFIDSILELGRADGGRKRYSLREFPLVEAVRTATETVEGRFAAHGLSVEVPEDLVVFADRGCVEQIAANLLDNAAKYAAAAGPVEVRASSARGMATLVVADRGPGVAASDLERMFARFWRADDSLSRATSGSGIGLSLARALAEGTGGTLVALLREGGGLEFALSLPERSA